MQVAEYPALAVGRCSGGRSAKLFDSFREVTLDDLDMLKGSAANHPLLYGSAAA
ncbi:hypothetical protein RGR602_CH00076 [Rhizobium gallicum bv. gallicum R602sp]|uniref:Uncharacterized protein n=1 Tax=Rhizobium gallicum bv. gallicum R602sp TaxID=1041138 RepID=A0A0B4WYZ6_9HYPH|nr:hypothetical protein RGR602_CH00076 [Rhizobium gallicum bv. gallicum R602sp]